MMIGIPKETFPGERRVAMIPAQLAPLTKAGLTVVVESGAGAAVGFPDAEFEEKGARIAASRGDVFAQAETLLQVRTLGANPEAGRADLDLLRSGQTVIGLCEPLSPGEAMKDLAARGVSVFSMELMPRISRAQSMDALSAMATIQGYKAVLLGADQLPRMFPMLMTAAGTVAPARVLVVGAGVAGLQAIATANRLGAVVRAYDVRPEVKEQVESLGAKFVELPLESADAQDKGGYAKDLGEDFYRRQQELMGRVVAESDVVITTAAVPGKPAPVLITRAMVAGMSPGSVIVDIAAERGGNCEATRPDETVVENGVSILGPVNLPSDIPFHASQMYARNIATFLLHLVKDGGLNVDLEDEITRETLVARGGEVVHPRVREVLGLETETAAQEESA
ncbi:MAG: Re/Si-specific NAD(P)(+) transhydrogenase subunit alpha [Nitrospinota bacterium]|jgi:NAD(P) transhydrogenase subunit alpha|nr:Re/Si-specific NAD(P)(+) transhydrogenase subunit alpha [Nitrospinota bacterium]MDP6483037.1 Re/Si-specific NAD(P)(+) transhydrogenase subunit alpha [Nitrospinota bacterium]HJM43820.1 Re/Si-specific NAD(P)(+) transhydrogenase subunit alpha [Nitrospinota bacterium]